MPHPRIWWLALLVRKSVGYMYGKNGHHSVETPPALDLPCAIMESNVSCSDVVMLFRTIVLFDFSSYYSLLASLSFLRIPHSLAHFLCAPERDNTQS